jgi:hypothetical protein
MMENLETVAIVDYCRHKLHWLRLSSLGQSEP